MVSVWIDLCMYLLWEKKNVLVQKLCTYVKYGEQFSDRNQLYRPHTCQVQRQLSHLKLRGKTNKNAVEFGP